MPTKNIEHDRDYIFQAVLLIPSLSFIISKPAAPAACAVSALAVKEHSPRVAIAIEFVNCSSKD